MIPIPRLFTVGFTVGIASALLGRLVLDRLQSQETAPAQTTATAATSSSLSSSSSSQSATIDHLTSLEQSFSATAPNLAKLVQRFTAEFESGLAANGSMLKMIPSYVTSRPNGNEQGSYLALDLGGTNFRVCLVQLRGNGRVRILQRKYTVSDALKRGSGTDLFDFFADCVARFLQDRDVSVAISAVKQPKLGFTFSFPVDQTAINRGTLMHWNKGFSCSDVQGHDVVQLLQSALDRRGVDVNVTAIVNDTVGSLIAHAYEDPQTFVGVILGTGTNAAYVEQLSNIPKWSGDRSGEMIVNTEWGAFNDETALPITKYDRLLDMQSQNPKQQIFEKMISGSK
eukprot:jgi/Hompol1/1235/HPOL_001562-RA